MAVATLDATGSEHDLAAEWMPALVAAYVETASIPQAAKRVGVAYSTVYRARREDAAFAAALTEAAEVLGDEVEGLLLQRCRKGDTIAIIFALKNLKPGAYSDRLELRHRHTGTVEHQLSVTGGREPREIDAATRHKMAELLEAATADPPTADPPDAVVVEPETPATGSE